MDRAGRAEERDRIRSFLWGFGAVVASYAVLRLLLAWKIVGPGAHVFWSPGRYLADFWAHPAGKLFMLATAGLLILRLILRRRDTFGIHALQVLVGVIALNWLIATAVPLAIQQISSSYLIFFYHFPAALSCFVFFTLLMVASVAYLMTEDPVWDRVARVAGQIGLVACTIVLTTGSTWASAAWNAWWVWDDPRLMSAAVMWLTYAGYVTLQSQLEDAIKRRRYSAVFGILAFLNLPIVHFAIRWFGAASHPMQFEDLQSDAGITLTRWFGVFVFITFYGLLYRWRLHREGVRDRLHSSLWQVRRLEEGIHS